MCKHETVLRATWESCSTTTPSCNTPIECWIRAAVVAARCCSHGTAISLLPAAGWERGRGTGIPWSAGCKARWLEIILINEQQSTGQTGLGKRSQGTRNAGLYTLLHRCFVSVCPDLREWGHNWSQCLCLQYARVARRDCVFAFSKNSFQSAGKTSKCEFLPLQLEIRSQNPMFVVLQVLNQNMQKIQNATTRDQHRGTKGKNSTKSDPKCGKRNTHHVDIRLMGLQ